jgi:TatD DNase family protein
MLFDTHCHYNLDPLKTAWEKHWALAQEHGVTGSVVVGTDHDSSRLACAIAEQTPGLFSSVGTHPSTYHSLVQDWLKGLGNSQEELESIVASDIQRSRELISESVVAIGEVGLDYFRLPKESKERSLTITLQQEAVAAYIQLAQELELPLIFHVRDSESSAYFDLLDILKLYLQPKQRFVLHCISGSKEYLLEALSLGAYIGIAGNVTYKTADLIRELVTLAPPNRILLETDAPFLPPQNFRGQTNEPWMISETAKFLHSTLGINTKLCYENALEFYDLELPQ